MNRSPYLILLIALVVFAGLVQAQNNCLEFDGTDDNVSGTSFSSVSDNFTYELWAYPTTTITIGTEATSGTFGVSGQRYAVGPVHGGSSGNAYAGISIGTNGVGVFEHADNYLPALLFWEGSISGWTHIAVCYTNKQAKLYVNGILVKTGLTSTKTVHPNSNLGLSYGYFEGKIDEFRLWNDVRTETEIRQNMYRELPDPGSESSLTAYFQMNSNLNDASSNSNNGTFNGGAATYTTSPAMFGPKNALEFDGLNDYVDCGINQTALGTEFTIEAWIYPESASNYRGVAGAHHDDLTNKKGIVFGQYTGSYLSFAFGTNSNWAWLDCSPPDLDTWTHISATYSSQNYIKVYYNGLLVGETNTVGTFAPYGAFWIGRAHEASDRYFDGKIDEVRIWGDVRSATEIRENMCKNLDGNESGLLAYYNCDHIQLNNSTELYELADYAANAYDGTVVNGTSAVSSDAFYTWLNTSSTDWNTNANWSTGSEPAGDNNIGIYNFGGSFPVFVNEGGAYDYGSIVLGPSASFTLSQQISLKGNLILESDLDINGKSISLNFTGNLIEDQGVLYGSEGSITTTRELNNISSENVAGLGAEISTTQNLGYTGITRRYGTWLNDPLGMGRIYYVAPYGSNENLDATLVIHYAEDELNGLNEANLNLYTTEEFTSWGSWSPVSGATVNTTENTITLSGINSFQKWWTASDGTYVTGNALNFDGTDDYVDCGINQTSLGTDFTIEAWIYPESGSNYKGVAGAHEDNGSSKKGVIFGQYESGNISFGLGTTANTWSVINCAPPELNKWTHIVAIYSSENYIKVYYNGLFAGETTTGTFDPYDYFWIGRALDGFDRYFDGKIDELRIWTDVRSEQEIRNNMCQTLNGNESGLLAYYRFNETSGNITHDATSNSNNGTIQNFDWEITDYWLDSDAFTSWTGNSNTAWATSGNWTDGAPLATSNVGIYNNSNNPVLSGSPTVNNLVLANSSTMTLSSGLTVNGNLILESNLDLNGNTITLGPDASLTEDAGLLSGSSGSISTTRDLSNINQNVAGLGAEITTLANMGSTTISRTHAAASNPTGINRKYTITPTTNTGLDATLVFHYTDSELNGLTEADLDLYKSPAGGNWIRQNASLNTTDNTLSLTGIDGFSSWTASEGFYLTGNALQFNESSAQYVEIPDNNAFDFTTNYTLEAWIYYTDWDAGDGIISKYNTGSSNGWKLQLAWTEGALVFDQMNTAAILTTNNWYHIAAVNDNGTRHLYVNGTEYPLSGSTTAPSVNTDYVAIGTDHNDEADPRYFTGKIDEVRVWNDARTETEIRTHMCKTLEGNEDNLVAYYNFNSATGSTLYDITGNGHHGTLQNSPVWTSSDAFNMWLGSSSSWSSAANWSSGAAPNSSSANVGILAQSNNPEISSQIQINNIVINENASLTYDNGSSHTIHGSAFNFGTTNINNGTDLTITGSLYVLPLSTVNVNPGGALTVNKKLETDFLLGDGTLNIHSDATGSGSLIINESVDGDINVERYLTRGKWHYIASPLNDSRIFNEFLGLSGGTNNDQFYWWDEDGSWEGNTGIWFDILNNPTGISYTANSFEAAQGYAINYAGSGGETITFVGTPYISNKSIDITKDNNSVRAGSNLIGNPFTSTIAANSNADENNFLSANSSLLSTDKNAIYLWNEQDNWLGNRDDYITISNSDGAKYLNIAQAFMVVKKDEGTSTLNFNANIRKHGTATFYKNTENDDVSRFYMSVENEEGLYNEILIAFMDGMSKGLDISYDAGKLKGNPDIALYTRLVEDKGKDFAHQALPPIKHQSFAVKTCLDVSNGGQYTFRIKELQNLDESISIELEDKSSGHLIDLRENGSYTFHISNPGEITERFVLHFNGTTAIEEPVSEMFANIWVQGNMIHMNCKNKPERITLTDITGRTLGVWDNTESIPAPITTGIYLLTVNTNNQRITKKIIVN